MTVQSTIVIIAFLLSYVAAEAQQIIKWNSKYLVNDTEYKMKEIDQFLIKDSTAYALYNKGFKIQKTANTAGIMSLSLITSGTLLFFSVNKGCDGFCGYNLFGYFLVLISPIPGLVGLGAQIEASRIKRAAINHFNTYYGLLPPSEKKNKMSIELSDNGLGLLVRF